jgi:hypothetical protein
LGRERRFLGIHDPLEVVVDAHGEPPPGDLLTDHVQVEVGDRVLEEVDRGEP